MEFTYQEYQNRTQKPTTNKTPWTGVGYFGLKEDGEEAIVRFMYASADEFKLNDLHSNIIIKGKKRKVNCLKTPTNPHGCPLCESGNKMQSRFFIKLLHYVKGEDGSIKALPKIWERSSDYADTLKNYIEEYGPLCDNLFKIKRNGVSGSTKTTYDILYASPAIYKPEIYIKDEHAFDNFDLFKNGVILSKSVEEMESLISQPEEQTPPNIEAPVTQQRKTYTF